LLSGLVFGACGDTTTENPAQDRVDTAEQVDASSGGDTATESDAATESDTATADTATESDTVTDAVFADAADSAAEVADSSTDVPNNADAVTPSNPCEAIGGLCIGGNPDACISGGGKLAQAGDSGCVFDDGPGLCCIPPAAEASGDTCQSHGGICAPIAGCNFTHGNFAPPSCWQQGGPGTVCCVPQRICGPETNYCCNDMTTFRPMCDRGEFTCSAFPDTEYRPRDQCP
jgi:hypothetical protein